MLKVHTYTTHSLSVGGVDDPFRMLVDNDQTVKLTVGPNEDKEGHRSRWLNAEEVRALRRMCTTALRLMDA